ncbi:MAG: molybdopterin-binding protein [Candidatus Methanomethylicia archaeon]|nr:molybdopterin-binding protein [Candidatus Methanomethylicia archaeon]MCX8169206.1 molybdopterin-binding protein [Candidatus Methanomethylicia archaeon]MDW7989012.1 molybdopterin-binding protein [Nitrososphaerota archaeon]
MKEIVVEIISIGEELLIGKVVNTNASWIARKITEIGWKVRRIITVGDDVNEIVSVIHDSINRGTNTIITTGGLGPTFDDKTMEAISKATNRPLKLSEEVLMNIEEKLRKKGRTLSEAAKKMAYIPDGSMIIHNNIGTAPGIILEYGKTIIIALPGVPNEMIEMFEKEVIKFIGVKHRLKEKEILLFNVPEAELAPTLIELMNEIPNIYIKSHPIIEVSEKPTLKIHIYSKNHSDDEWRKIIEKIIKKILEKHVYCEFKEV